MFFNRLATHILAFERRLSTQARNHKRLTR
jgi:hypothetical protein